MPRFPSYDVELRRNSDGEIRLYHVDSLWDEDGGAYFWWVDGNMACDCNRADCFTRASGVTPVMGDDPPCGSSRFTALRAIFPDGTSEKLDA